MHKGLVEVFSDGVIAFIVTIMILVLKVPHGTDLEEPSRTGVREGEICG